MLSSRPVISEVASTALGFLLEKVWNLTLLISKSMANDQYEKKYRLTR
jgi:hypothetical protein